MRLRCCKFIVSAFLMGMVFCTIQMNSHASFGFTDDQQRIYKEADLIVEGYLYADQAEAEKKFPGYVGASDQSVTFNLGSVNEMTFRVKKVYKGMIDRSPLIHIYSYPKISKDRSSLESRKEYILFLRKHPTRSGYQILDYGRGKWQVFDYNGTKKLKSWNQSATLRSEDEYKNYSDLVDLLIQK